MKTRVGFFTEKKYDEQMMDNCLLKVYERIGKVLCLQKEHVANEEHHLFK